MKETQWNETVILVDADYLDRVAFDLIVNFERMIDRRIPAGDLCRWLDCIALDGGLRPGDNAVQAVFIHSGGKAALDNLHPGTFATDLNGRAFRDNLGEFGLSSFPVEEVVSAQDFYMEVLETLAKEKDVKRLLVVADMDQVGDRVRRLCARTADKAFTLFAMQPLTGRGFAQEILGYSLMSALGIRSEEIRG